MAGAVAGSCVAAAIAGCQSQPVACTAESAADPVIGIVKEQLERKIAAEVRGDDGGRRVSLSKIRAAIGQLAISLEDIRTSKEDPNSTKRFCAATLKLRFPGDVLDDADKAREATGLRSVSDLADDGDVDRAADSFTTAIDFNVQPTDDGSKVFAETESGNNMFAFAAEVLTSSLMRGALEDARRERLQGEASADAQQTAALTEQRNANLASARVDNQIALQFINATWKALSGDTRRQLLPAQRAWIRKKDADCRVESSQVSTEPTEVEAARVACDTRVTQERANALVQFRSDEPAPMMQAPAEDEPSPDDNETSMF